ASHGWSHIRVNTQTQSEFSRDVSKTKLLLEEISGTGVKGYRAPSYSISLDNLWAFDKLAEAGYQYSSSVAPVKHDLYGCPDAPRFPVKAASGNLIEIPISTIRILSKNIHCSGGGWFRLFPYTFSRWAINRVNYVDRQPAVFYFHPWEIDPNQPRINGASAKARFRHYLNLRRMEPRLNELLDDFSWGRMDDIFLGSDHPVQKQLTPHKWTIYEPANS
ncbi:MAG: XrtA system polysaccharide deacetylase, partial [bacterium]